MGLFASHNGWRGYHRASVTNEHSSKPRTTSVEHVKRRYQTIGETQVRLDSANRLVPGPVELQHVQTPVG